MSYAPHQRDHNRAMSAALHRLAGSRRAPVIASGLIDPVERFLAVLRGTHPEMVRIYTQGGCYQLFVALRTIWPQARPWSDINHVWTEIDGRFYDIEGRHLVLPSNAASMDACLAARAHRWHRRTFFRLPVGGRTGGAP